MPVVVPKGYEEQWTEQVKDADELRGLIPIMMGWSRMDGLWKILIKMKLIK